MASTIASLVVELKADMTELVSASQASRDHLKHIESSAKSLEGGLSSLKGFAIEAGTALVGAFTVGSVVEGIKAGIEATIEYGKQLRDLSDETGTNVVKFQALASATSDFGIDTQKTAGLIFQLSQRIAGGDQSATAAVARLGLSLEELKRQSPDQLFVNVVTAVNSMENPLLRAGNAADLFGAKAGAAVQRLGKDFADTVAKSGELNVAMGKDAVDAAAKWSTAVDNLGTNMKSFAGNTLAPLLAKMGEYIEKAGFIFNMKGNAPAAPAALGGDKLTLDQARAQLGEGGGPLTFGGKAVDATNALFGEQAANTIKALTAALKALTPEQERFLEQLYDMGQLSAENAKAFNISAQQVEAFKRKEADLIEQQTQLSINIQAEQRAYTDLAVAGTKALDALDAKTLKVLESTNAMRQATLDAGRAAQASLNERGLAAGGSPFDSALATRDAARKDLEIQRDTLAKTRGGAGLTSDEVMAFQAMSAKIEADFDDAAAKIRAGGDKVGENLGKIGDAAYAGARQVGDAFAAFKGITVAGTQSYTADRNPTNDISAYFARANDNLLAGGINFNATLGLSSLAPRRAMGGPVSAGRPYIVGDGGGPEVFVPAADGAIVPHGVAAGGAPVVIHVNVSGVMLSNDPSARQQLAAALGPAITEAARQVKQFGNR